MTDHTSISEAEALIMQLLWESHPRSAEEICQALCEQQQWQVSTVKTLLNRLLNKGAIRADKQSRYFLYSPVLQKEVWLQQESQGFLNRLFQGRLAPLVAHFSQQQNLSAQDIADIKKIIQELEK
ncbi:BlaI/MecI/CopY family transcriptional regulator [Undibacterium squillarum]|uniref:BlaI family transcriptional regulator n=1 Tax=Undibacterium squillarum TaxID=1131567 RepID=A0ABQ2XU30_9BURK|nr:BlaI/MecI/CopY family transcriptional regulator [Undibacterium squillarum]GGX33830.1 BlaI family transcriptional regulator [Undibacterium squillarum]